MAALRDPDEEIRRSRGCKYDLSYIKLDGTIGCMVNGAGLAMATMDIIKLFRRRAGELPRCRRRCLGEKVTAAFKIIVSDPHVKGILVNIFGGIMKCDIIAEGIVAAAKEIALSVPLVVRLEGTNVDKGKEILARSGLPIVSGNDLADAAQKIVKAVQGDWIASHPRLVIALVRLRARSGGNGTPDDMIPRFEQNGSSCAVGARGFRALRTLHGRPRCHALSDRRTDVARGHMAQHGDGARALGIAAGMECGQSSANPITRLSAGSACTSRRLARP